MLKGDEQHYGRYTAASPYTVSRDRIPDKVTPMPPLEYCILKTQYSYCSTNDKNISDE